MSTIPVNTLISVTPSVLQASGQALALNGLILSEYAYLPFGAPVSFPTYASVAAYFGATSLEAEMAQVYFSGFTTATMLPTALLFSRYPVSPIAAFIIGGTQASLTTLANLNAIKGSLTLTIDGTVYTSSADVSTVFATATSPSSAASSLTSLFTFTSGATGTTITWSSQYNAFVVTTPTGTGLNTVAYASGSATTASASSGGTCTLTAGSPGVMTLVSAPTSGTITLGSTLSATGVTGSVVISALASGVLNTPGSTYTLTGGTTSLEATTISFSTSGIPIALSQATGATLSQGSANVDPVTFMDTLQNYNSDWAAFTSAFEPSLTLKEGFAQWVNGTDLEFLYVCYDTDITATENPSNFIGFGNYLTVNETNGVCVVYKDPLVAAFVLGMAASTNYNAINGRISYAYRTGSGITPSVTDAISAANLITNGYNYYGAYATAAQPYNIFYNGQVSGEFNWVDSYVNQIWLNSNLQLALITLFTSANSLPYNNIGYGLIKAACQSILTQAVSNGVISKGVSLSSTQAALVNSQAGTNIANTLYSAGYYLQILDATATSRGNRTTPPCTLWYMDGGSINTLTLASIDIE
jgi:hypothetical protein